MERRASTEMSPERLTLWMSRTSNGGYQTHAWSVRGEATAGLDAPSFFPPVLRRAGESAGPHRDVIATRERWDGGHEDELGRRLHQALFSGAVRDLMQRCCEAARANGTWVQLSLEIDPADAEAAWLDDIPWELLHDDSGFLGLHPDWAIVRYLQSPFLPQSIPLVAPLRIMVVIASPKGAPFLDVEQERQGIEAAWQASAVKVTFVAPPTVHALNRCLAREGPFHVVHFIGHGR